MELAVANPFRRLKYWTLFLLFILPLLTSCDSRKIIVNGLDEKEANEILVFLSTKNIDAIKVKEESAGGGANKAVLWDVSVNSEQVNEAMSILNQAGLPRRRAQNLLGIFQGSSLVPSEMQEQIRYQAGMAEQIASTIRKIDGILDADVQVSFPKEDPLNPGKEKGKITASVYVKHNGVLDDPNSHLVTKIKRLVAASITGLDYDNVTVIADRARFNEALGAFFPSSTSDEDKQYVSIWTIILAKESATRFRVIFFTFSLLILLLLLSLIWLLWKLYPILKNHGGFRELFHLHPIAVEAVSPPVSETPAEPAGEDKGKKKESDSGLIDKDIDET